MWELWELSTILLLHLQHNQYLLPPFIGSVINSSPRSKLGLN